MNGVGLTGVAEDELAKCRRSAACAVTRMVWIALAICPEPHANLSLELRFQSKEYRCARLPHVPAQTLSDPGSRSSLSVRGALHTRTLLA